MVNNISTGLVTDGEFSSLRTQGETRPLHIWQLVHDARESVSRLSRGTLLKMLVQTGGNYKYNLISKYFFKYHITVNNDYYAVKFKLHNVQKININ